MCIPVASEVDCLWLRTLQQLHWYTGYSKYSHYGLVILQQWLRVDDTRKEFTQGLVLINPVSGNGWSAGILLLSCCSLFSAFKGAYLSGGDVFNSITFMSRLSLEVMCIWGVPILTRSKLV